MFSKYQRKNFFFFILICMILYSAEFRSINVQENNESIKKNKDENNQIVTDENNLIATNVPQTDTNNSKQTNFLDKMSKLAITTDDADLVQARKNFDSILPKTIPLDLLDDGSILALLQYFYIGRDLLEHMEDNHYRQVMQKAYYNTVGGFLLNYLVPITKYSYYAGKVELKTVGRVMAFYAQCLEYLQVSGNSLQEVQTKSPLLTLNKVNIKPLGLDIDNYVADAPEIQYLNLDINYAKNDKEASDGKMIVDLPKLKYENNERVLSNIWLPFKYRKRSYNLKSNKSAYVLVNYYRSVRECYNEKGLSQKAFNRNFKNWIHDNLESHLSDDEFYPGLGGVLNLYETLQNDEEDKINEKSSLINRVKIERISKRQHHIPEKFLYSDNDEMERIERNSNMRHNSQKYLYDESDRSEKLDNSINKRQTTEGSAQNEIEKVDQETQETDKVEKPDPEPEAESLACGLGTKLPKFTRPSFCGTTWRAMLNYLLSTFIVIVVYSIVTGKISSKEVIKKTAKCDFSWFTKIIKGRKGKSKCKKKKSRH